MAGLEPVAVILIGPLITLTRWRTISNCSRKVLNSSGIGRGRKIL